MNTSASTEKPPPASSIAPVATAAPAARVAIFLPTLHGGGAERVLLDLAQAFLRAGHLVDLVVMSAPPGLPLSDLIPAGVRTIDLRCRRLWTSGPAFARYIKEVAPAGIIAAMPLANAIAASARWATRAPARLVLTEHNARSLAFGDADNVQHRVLRPWVRLSYRFADVIVAVSAGVADRVRDMPGIQAEQVRVVYNPAYSNRIHELAAAPAPHRWLEDASVPVIVGSGRLEPQKDFATLLKAFAALRRGRPARLIILGEGSQEAALHRLVENLGIEEHVVFPGFVTNPWAYVARASVFALSSVHEGLGNVLIEAMACGTPVVSTDCPAGPSEILEAGRYGPLVPPGDPAALAGAITEAMDRPVDRAILRERARFFSIDTAAAGYLHALGFSS
jgi:glycosyltransferase involved in cell wall biosynthesis